MAYEFKLPDIGEGVHEGEIAKWHVKPGDTLKEDQPMVEVMTDKVTVEITAPVAGTVGEILAREGQVVKVGSVIIQINETGAVSKAPQQAQAISANGDKKATAVIERPKQTGKVLAAPAVRKLAHEMDVDLSRVTGSGPGGRIRKPDLAVPAPVAGGEKRVAYRGMRKRIGDHLVHAKHTAPHFTYVEEADLTALVQLKADLEPVAQQKNIKLTYLPFIMKAVIEGLRQFPQLNSSLDETAQEIVLKYDYNIGVAMATAEGLIVPVVHQVQHKSLFEIASEISQLSDKARQNKLTLPELQGGTFTLTSIGSIGGIFSAPIINYPEVAIIGIQKIEKRPVVRSDEIVIREMTYFCISCDHRVVDGAEAAMFMKTVIEALEHPGRLLVA